jgi:cell division protein FtsQ
VVGLGILAVALGGYAVARETSIFAIHRIDVRGGSSRVDATVQQALAPLLGRSLVGLDGGEVLRRVDALPTVVSAAYDRSFPNTLRISVVPEHPAAVLRVGASAWLVSTRGRVISTLAAQAEPRLPRIWLAAKKSVAVGQLLPVSVAAAARSLGSAGSFRSRVATASFAGGMLVFRLRSGIALLLGKPAGIPLKVAVAVRALNALPAGSRFLDVSVPGRPVAGSRIPVQSTARTSSRR